MEPPVLSSQMANFAMHGGQSASPISKVSPEILSAFFREAFHHGSTRTSLTLSHVSSRWRHISIHDPFIWNTINLVPHGESTFAKLCIGRSKQTDLEIRYADDREWILKADAAGVVINMDNEVVELKPFDPAILHLARCRKLCLYFASRVCAFDALRGLKSAGCPRLACFDMVLDGGPNAECWIPQPRPGDIFLGGAPLLTYVHMLGVSPLQCHIPLERVTTLSLTALEWHTGQGTDLHAPEFIRILQEASRTLQSLRLEGVQGLHRPGETPMPWPKVELPALTRFAFGGLLGDACDAPAGNYPTDVWNALCMPSLEDLRLYHLNCCQIAAVWAALSGKPGARVKSLKLCSVDMHGVQYRIPQTFPNLHRLAVSAHMIGNIFPSLIAADEDCADSGKAAVWSRLECLSLLQLTVEAEAALVRRFICGRERVKFPIKKVVFFAGQPPDRLLCFARGKVHDVTFQPAEVHDVDSDDDEEGEDEESDADDDEGGGSDLEST
ncbi:hypothetical protein FIBSPDRAFT_939008 [Athelia psychrophila]|uniref:F-box domain-containing protein n=1 Tax=Athelia psychrophila TaxID=1759441 RepID=A0A167WUH6_9AGAM|nr:hypothetical protein FIBSPDRAFT_939985 [Fibularhizoctonia sp. CBS 109695]KZP08376.1 hypothetical protein FIBSPDRAFT_939008 [Fibularhizoctonia sp. CBS 109695]